MNVLHPAKQQPDDDAKRCKATTKPLRPDDGKSRNTHRCHNISIFPTETYKTGGRALSQPTSTKIIILCGLDKRYENNVTIRQPNRGLPNKYKLLIYNDMTCIIFV